MRIGGKKRPFYRVVVVPERAKRTGAYIELLGTYNPLTEPKDIKLKQDRIDYWIKQGAQPSVGYLRIIGKAPKRPPRKPKKEKQTPAQPSAPVEPIATETTPKSQNNEKEERMDDSAVKPKSTEIEKSESVQNKNEGSA